MPNLLEQCWHRPLSPFLPTLAGNKDSGTILATFSTGPALRHTASNLFGEVLGTAVLVMGILAIGPNNVSAGLGPIIVGLIVFAIGFSLGSTTGYAINPARDLGPRIMHAILPIPNKEILIGPIAGSQLSAQFSVVSSVPSSTTSY